MAAKKGIDPTKSVKLDPAAELAQDYAPTGKQKKEKEDYTRANIFISEDDRAAYFDFQVYAKSVGLSTSGLIISLIKQTVNAHKEEIDAAKQKFEAAKKEYNII